MRKKQFQALGELESYIMEYIWRHETASVRDVLFDLHRKKDTAYTTVMTVMDRLHTKKLLSRKKDSSGAYLYKARVPKERFMQKESRKLLEGLFSEFGDVAIAQFVDFLKNEDQSSLEKWKQELRKLV